MMRMQWQLRAMHIVVIVMPMAILVVTNTAYLLSVPILCIMLNKDLIEGRNFSTGRVHHLPDFAIASAWVRTELDSLMTWLHILSSVLMIMRPPTWVLGSVGAAAEKSRGCETKGRPTSGPGHFQFVIGPFIYSSVPPPVQFRRCPLCPLLTA
jgi:hypothetical protein